MTTATLAGDIGVVQGVGQTILSTLEAIDPAVEVPAETASAILTELGNLVSGALTAWSNASGRPITVETVLALLPDPAPLPEPS